MAAQIEYLKPDAMVAYPNLLERMAVVVEAEGKDLRRILRPVQHIWWGGARLNKELRSLMGEQFDVEIHEHFGIGDMGFHAMDCAGQDGAHFQDDRFFIENLNPDRLEPQDLEIPGELAITALQDESMNYVRWRTEDLGIVKTDPCECGRTSPRVVIFGRVWERTKVDGAVILPHNIESVLLRLFGHESPFQILRSRDGQDPVRLRIAIQSGFDPATVEEAIRSELGITLPVESVTADVILAGSPAYKYRQVVDV
jgi:phenylacetate-CoA ligase